jgi:ATP-binding protein involved in chromosome partitioning
MEGSDQGKPITISEPESVQSHAFVNVAKSVAGRISVIAKEMNAEEKNEAEFDQMQSHNASHA